MRANSPQTLFAVIFAYIKLALHKTANFPIYPPRENLILKK